VPWWVLEKRSRARVAGPFHDEPAALAWTAGRRPHRYTVTGSAAATGREAVSGSRTDLYRLVWCEVFALEPGDALTAPELVRRLDRGRAVDRGAVVRALRRAEEARLCTPYREPARVPRAHGGRPPVEWRRLEWPDEVSVAFLVGRGASRPTAQNILSALEAAGWLVGTYRRAS
jgi:hypothetical protein